MFFVHEVILIRFPLSQKVHSPILLQSMLAKQFKKVKSNRYINNWRLRFENIPLKKLCEHLLNILRFYVGSLFHQDTFSTLNVILKGVIQIVPNTSIQTTIHV